MINFSEAENKFRELQARVQRGEPLSEDQYQEELAKLMVQDDHGIFWSLEPGTGRWLFFNGTEWVPGTPPRVAAAPEAPSPVEAAGAPGPAQAAVPGPAQAAAPGPSQAVAPGPAQAAAPGPSQPVTTEAALPEYAAAEEVPPIESESVPTYVRTGEVREPMPGVVPATGIPPRPVRGTFVGMAEGDRPWLPFAIGAIVLMLCAVVLFFGVRNAPFLAGAPPTATATVVAVLDISPTVEIIPTDTEVPTKTSVPESPTASVVTVTTTDNVRLRAGPGTKYGVLATMASGTEMTAVGRNSDSSWIQVQQPGKTDLGWLSAQYVTVSGDLNTLPVVESQPTAAPTKKPAGKPTATETPAG